MSTTKIEIPGEDAWVLARLGKMFSDRLIHGSDDSLTRQSILRFLFGIQRLPILIPDLCVSLSVGRVCVEINSELFGLSSYSEDGHTEFRLQYFSSSNHCIRWSDYLVGDDKRQVTEDRLKELEESLEETEYVSIEDNSIPGYVDELPLDDYLEYSLSFEKL